MRALQKYLDELPAPTSPQEAFELAAAQRTVELLDTIRAIGIASLIGLVSIGIIGVMFVRSDNRSEEIASCRSSFSAELVTGPTAAALKALSDFGPDSAEYREAADSADPKRFIALAEMSRTNTGEFLRICRDQTPG